LPRFADLTGDARRAALQGLAGSLSSAAAIGHAIYLTRSLASTGGTYSADGATVTLAYGYPSAATVSGGIQDFTGFTASAAAGVATYAKSGSPGTCNITYTEVTSGGFPTIAYNSGGC
jgi:MSHA pilin protein MshA